jgi:DNA polymerase I-like protein with 3'-5' exonuclease and polymerase domains
LLLTVDFESFYDRDYSFTKLTTEEYVRDPRFEAIGVSVKANDEPAQWFSGPKNKMKAWLERFPWGEAAAVAHNAMFDMAVLAWHFDIRPKRILDTLSMARPLHGLEMSLSLASLLGHYGLGEKGTAVLNALGKRRLDFTPDELEDYGDYCINDVEKTYLLLHKLLPDFPSEELKLIDLTTRMFTEPVLELDTPVLERHLFEVKEKKDRLLSKAMVSKDKLMSNNKLAELLRSCGVEPPTKLSKTTGKETFAFAKTDEAFKALAEHENPIVQAMVAARLGAKSTIEETRTERFIQISKRGPLPIPLRYYGAHTGRWSGEDRVNLQNLPRGSVLKKAILAPDGFMVCDCDSSQIEARIVAWLAGQVDLVDVFHKNNAEIAAGVAKEDMKYDPYKIMASQIYGKPAEEISQHPERFVGKTTILGAGYGMGAARFQAQLQTFGVYLPLEECEYIIKVYRSTYPAIPQLWYDAGDALEAMMVDAHTTLGPNGFLKVEGRQGILLPNGLRIRYPNLRYESNPDARDGKEMVYDQKRGKATIPTRIYGGKVVENLCQALARIIIGQQMLMIARRYRVAMTVHDSVVPLLPEAQAREGQAFVEDCMRMRPKWAPDLPLNCESHVWRSYGG